MARPSVCRGTATPGRIVRAPRAATARPTTESSRRTRRRNVDAHPSRIEAHAWYGHTRQPSVTLPPDSGASRCGQRSDAAEPNHRVDTPQHEPVAEQRHRDRRVREVGGIGHHVPLIAQRRVRAERVGAQIHPASVPTIPRPKCPLDCALSAVIGGLFGVGTSWGRSFTFRSDECRRRLRGWGHAHPGDERRRHRLDRPARAGPGDLRTRRRPRDPRRRTRPGVLRRRRGARAPCT